jgi:hypothetical protein
MTLPDTRRLLVVVLAVAAQQDPLKHALEISNWRQAHNQLARQCHAKTRARAQRAQARKTRLRNTG